MGTDASTCGNQCLNHIAVVVKMGQNVFSNCPTSLLTYFGSSDLRLMLDAPANVDCVLSGVRPVREPLKYYKLRPVYMAFLLHLFAKTPER